MLFAPPTLSHEDRLTRPRVCSSPTPSRSPPTGNRHPNSLNRSPPNLGRSPPISARESPTIGRSPPPRSLQMSALNEFSPVTSTHATTPRRSPQTTPTINSLTHGSLPLSSTGGSSTSGSSLTASLPHLSGGAGGSTPPLHHPLLGYVPHGNKILSRNLNGTLAVTSQPSNESELQLYRVLQRANLLTYYETFISQGGDDVQQLCEAGEEEFLEIMALVGMASKPLHVRRLQKALQEWVSNPSLFQIPLVPNLPPSVVAGYPTFPSRTLLSGNTTPTPAGRPSPPMSSAQNHVSSPGLGIDTKSHNMGSCSPREPSVSASGLSAIPTSREICGIGTAGSRGTSPVLPVTSGHLGISSHLPSTLPLQNPGCESPGLPYPPPSGSPGGGSPGSQSPQGANPTLHEAQIARLAQAASELAANLPPFEARKDGMNKRKMSKELEMIMNMSEDDPRRMDELRKYAAIYGRFDCKRKPEKPLSLHEVSVNEAAAQICKYMPALLTRRDELFPLARQVVRDSGYQYSKGHSRSQTIIGRDDEPPRNKRSRTDSGPDHLDHKQEQQWKKRQERLESISEELRAMSDRAEEVRNSLTSGTGNLGDLTQQMDALHTRHAQLTVEQNELLKAHQKSYFPRSRSERSCSEEAREDSDSQFSYSANNSPSQVISSSQGNIIAVANPALSLSSAMPVNHSLHEDDRHSIYPVSNSSKQNVSAIKQEPGSPTSIPKSE